MEAGRELDALVAERVMGWSRGCAGFYNDGLCGKQLSWRWNQDGDIYSCANDCNWFQPSCFMLAAWAVVERMRELGWKFQLDWDGPEPAATFWKDEASLFDWTRGPAPSAISNAALAALDAKEEG